MGDDKVRRTPGQVGYEGYREASKGVSLVSGAPLPGWDLLDPEIRDAWSAAADSILDANSGGGDTVEARAVVAGDEVQKVMRLAKAGERYQGTAAEFEVKPRCELEEGHVTCLKHYLPQPSLKAGCNVPQDCTLAWGCRIHGAEELTAEG